MTEVNVVVFGLQHPTCVLQDLMMDVRHGTCVTIPGDRAYKSKDLWRAIGQKQLFRLNSGGIPQSLLHMVRPPEPEPPPTPTPTPPPPPVPTPPPAPSLEEENQALKDALDAQSKKLDAILGMLQAGVSPMVLAAAVTPKRAEVVASETPTFIPSVIAPERAESRIEAKTEQAEGSSVNGAAERLRELRQKPKQ